MAAPRTTSRTAPKSTTPKTRPDLDLDALEIEEDRPLVVKIGGRNVTLVSVHDLDWQIVLAMNTGDPRTIIDHIIAPEDREHFFAQKFSAKKLQHLMEFYLDHYRVDVGESGA